jgi:hypothetical protein
VQGCASHGVFSLFSLRHALRCVAVTCGKCFYRPRRPWTTNQKVARSNRAGRMQNQGLTPTRADGRCKCGASLGGPVGGRRADQAGAEGVRRASVARGRRHASTNRLAHALAQRSCITPITPGGVNPSPASVKHGVVGDRAGSLADGAGSALDAWHGSHRTATRACGRSAETDNRRPADLVQGTRHASVATRPPDASRRTTRDPGHTLL